MRSIWTAWLAVLVLSATALGQGTGPYLNFESPVHESILVDRVGNRDLLLVCNTPDSSVEVYTATASPSFVCRVPVGQEPVTVVVKPSDVDSQGTRRFYTANWLGDSLSSFDLTPTGTVPVVTCTAQRSMAIGDEPVGITFLPTTPNEPWTQPGQPFHEALLVTFSAQAGWGLFHPESLRHMGALPQGGTLAHRELLDPSKMLAVKDPRAVAFDPTATNSARLVIANFRGGNSPVYDFDLWISDNLLTTVGTEAATKAPVGGLGTANYDLAFRADGALFVCGQFARNHDFPAGVDPISAKGEPHFQQMVLQSTGFVRSFLGKVTNLASTPTVTQILDLNLDPITGRQHRMPVTQPTAVAIYDTGNPLTSRIFVTGFNSDTLGVVRDDPSATPTLSVVDRISVAPTTIPFSDLNPGNPMRGPRSLALLDDTGTSNDLLFVYNRLEHSITVLDAAYTNPAQAVLGTTPLQYDPTPAYIKDNRKFLYGSRMSGGGSVSCAACHLDGNSDFLFWNLSDGIDVPNEGMGLPDALGPNPGIKGPMVTQPLRGLVNFEIADDLSQDDLYSNRPYHWRGDRGVFEHFDGAFKSLMGSTPGISAANMTLYRDMVFSIHYPPNPDQRWNRVYSGSMFDDPANPDPADLADPSAGSGAQRGLKLFHIQNQDGVACTSCHTLPDGSNNRLTETRGFFASLEGQNIETAQMKFLFLKNKRLTRYDKNTSKVSFLHGQFGAVTGECGLTHAGFRPAGTPEKTDDTLSVHNFIQVTFPTIATLDQEDLTAYTREFDSGVAPLVGFTATVNFAEYNVNPGNIQTVLTDLETQPKAANCGLAVHARIGGVLHGFWFDVSDSTTPYHEVPYGSVLPVGDKDQSQLLDYLDQFSGVSSPDNALIFHFTPLGNERRIAFLDSAPPPAMPVVAPAAPTLGPCVTNTANSLVPFVDFFQYWSTVWVFGNAGPPTVGLDINPELAKFTFQENLFFHASAANPPNFGLQAVDEAPRRFRVSAAGIQHGAVLRLYAATPNDIASAPSPGQPPTTTPVPGTNVKILEAPIYARIDAAAGLVWETAVEVDAVVMGGLLNGGPHNALVAQAWDDVWANPTVSQLIPNLTTWVPAANVYDPMTNNWYFVEVDNVPGNVSSRANGGWQRLTVQ